MPDEQIPGQMSLFFGESNLPYYFTSLVVTGKQLLENPVPVDPEIAADLWRRMEALEKEGK